MNSCDTTRNISLGFDELKRGRWRKVVIVRKGGRRTKERGKFTFLDFGLLHLILEILLEFSFFVVGELGEVKLGGGGAEIHG